MKYTTTTNLFSSYELPTGDARRRFAKFRALICGKTTREVLKVYNANRAAVLRYCNDETLQDHANEAACRRDFCAAVLNQTRGLKFDYSKNGFNY